MILNWQQKIILKCQEHGIDPELYSENEELREWLAKCFRFDSSESFNALATTKDIISGMALPMLPDHSSYEYALMMDSVEMMEQNYDLYEDESRTTMEVKNLLKFIEENFSTEMKIVAVKTLLDCQTFIINQIAFTASIKPSKLYKQYISSTA